MKRLENEDDAAPRDPPAQIWNKRGLPHRGWIDGGVWDACNGADDPETIVRCEMCGQTRVRLLHLMTHPEYKGILQVGPICAEKMVLGYVTKAKKDSE